MAVWAGAAVEPPDGIATVQFEATAHHQLQQALDGVAGSGGQAIISELATDQTPAPQYGDPFASPPSGSSTEPYPRRREPTPGRLRPPGAGYGGGTHAHGRRRLACAGGARSRGPSGDPRDGAPKKT